MIAFFKRRLAARREARYARDYARGFAWAERELMLKQTSPLIIRFSLQWMPPIAFDHGALDAVVMFEKLLRSSEA